MNFQYKYLDPPQQTQGSSSKSIDNLTFSGALGMVQKRVSAKSALNCFKITQKTKFLQEGDFLLGDVAITYERSIAFEFTFFTLADSGAFVTHVPKSLNEALALVRPFQWEVWFLFIFTIFVSGPSIYFVIVLPSWWQRREVKKAARCARFRGRISKRTRAMKMKYKFPGVSKQTFQMKYLREMSYGITDVPAANRRYLRGKRDVKRKILPTDLFNKCIWFAITLFLRQCEFHSLFNKSFY